MRGCPWYVVLLASVMSTASCSEGGSPPEATEAQEVVKAARERFKVLDDLVDRGLEFEQVEGGFRPATTPGGVAPRGQRASTIGGLWSKPGRHHLRAELPARSGGVMRLSNGPVTIEVRPVGARNSAGAVAGRALVYRDVYPGADSIFVAEKQRIEEFVVLRAERTPRRFEYEVTMVRGGRVRQLAGVVEVLDTDGNAWLRLARPYLIDADGNRINVAATLTSSRLVLSLPRGVGRFPVLLDPGWTSTGKMTTARYRHSATLLLSGKVLVAGGDNALSSAELYNPVSGTWTTTGSMASGRLSHSATLLSSGKVLVAGGSDGKTALSSAELYGPVSGAWITTKGMAQKRTQHTATLLPSGKVLVAGGENGSGYNSSAELYDLSLAKWQATGAMTASRYRHTATLLNTGQVLVAGGSDGGVLSSADLYDPVGGTWIKTGDMARSRRSHAAALLKTGQVIVTGGYGAPGSTAELFDPASGKWKVTVKNMVKSRRDHTATLLDNGKILVVGGANAGLITELYDPAAGTWTTAKNLSSLTNHTATLLKTGQVLATGGYSSFLYDPSTGLPCTLGSQCISGHCSDGICCESACNGECRRCLLQDGVGTCGYVGKGMQDKVAQKPCIALDMACDGKGHCRKLDGQPCQKGDDCISTHCADGYCCDSACTDTCKACHVPGAKGTCSHLPPGGKDPSAGKPCTGVNSCNGQGACLLAKGQLCSGPQMCSTGHCMDHVCCDTACQDTCMTCALAGK